MISRRRAKVKYTERRQGDPAILVASYEKIYRELGWEAKHSLSEIIETAWNWHLKNV